MSCDNKKKIANPGDYNFFMKPGVFREQVSNTREQLRFWEQRLQKDTGNFVDMLEMAWCHLHIFKIEGEVNNLKKADSLLKRSSGKLNNTDPEMLFALAQNSITQHQFRQASYYNQQAGERGGTKYKNHLVGFDTKMELGELMLASGEIEKLRDKSAFDYLIRKSKLEDKKGHLDQGIELMEQAFEKVKNAGKSVYCWTLSNLADMYGHAGRVQEAYDAYLKVLNKDSSYMYALRGIAWIAYSHDHNAKEAKRILQFISGQTNMPDLLLRLSEMEKWEGNDRAKMKYISEFMDEVTKPGYGDMYNKYLIQVYTNEYRDFDKAEQLAEEEIVKRATPETYDWLAWVCYNRGDIEKAYLLSNNYVYKRNFEPDALMHTALVFSAAGKKEKAKELLEECLAGSFELGPVKTKFIQAQLKLL
jgi:tetratricopeptide (TPR) repeat protein